MGGVDAPESAGCSAEQHGGEQGWQGADVESVAESHSCSDAGANREGSREARREASREAGPDIPAGTAGKNGGGGSESGAGGDGRGGAGVGEGIGSGKGRAGACDRAEGRERGGGGGDGGAGAGSKRNLCASGVGKQVETVKRSKGEVQAGAAKADGPAMAWLANLDLDLDGLRAIRGTTEACGRVARLDTGGAVAASAAAAAASATGYAAEPAAHGSSKSANSVL